MQIYYKNRYKNKDRKLAIALTFKKLSVLLDEKIKVNMNQHINKLNINNMQTEAF